MNVWARLLSGIRANKILFSILLLAAALRLVGIGYGLPLMLVADEQPFTLAALKMLELHTLLPALHSADFAHILYYPPYLSYLYLLPFALIIGIKYVLWHGAAALFVPQLVSDLSPFFLASRTLQVALGTASIYLVYQTALMLFQSRWAALVSAFLLATSITHIALSMTGRHWTAVTFLTISTLWVLTSERIPQLKRYGYALLIAGFGMGVSTISVLLLFPIGLHFLFLGTPTFREASRSSFLWLCALASIALALLPSLLYPRSNGFVADMTLGNSKSFFDFLASPLQLFAFPFATEPVLIGLALYGLLVLWRAQRRFFFFVTTWVAFYAWVFYLFFRFETRFFLPLFPLFALLGGYACSRSTHTKKSAALILVLLLLPLAGALRFSWLVVLDDTRAHAREWVLEHIPAGGRVLVYADLTRIPTTAPAIEELRAIDPSALRKVDEAELALNNTNRPYALNLYTVQSDAFFNTLPAYAKEHSYEYVLIETTDLSMNPERERAFTALMTKGTLLEEWKGLGPTTSMGGSSFRDPFWKLFSGPSLGPDMVLYKLPL